MILNELFNNETGQNSPLTFSGTKKWREEKDFFKKWFSRPFLTGGWADQKIKEELSSYEGIPQETEYTCGVASIRNILKYFGKSIPSEKELEKECQTSPDYGTTPESMIKILRKNGFPAQAKQINNNILKSYLNKKIPIIVLYNHTDSNGISEPHWSVAIGYDDNNLLIYDTYENKKIKYSWNDWNNIWQGRIKEKFYKNYAVLINYQKNLNEEGRIVKGVNTTVDVNVDSISIENKKFGNKVTNDGYPVYSFHDSAKIAGKIKINEVYIGDFSLSKNEIKNTFKFISSCKPIKEINNGNYTIKICKYSNDYVLGIEGIGYIILEKNNNYNLLQWTRNYVIPEYRGKGIPELLLNTALTTNLRPILSDDTFTPMNAKNFENMIKRNKFNIKIFDTKNKNIINYDEKIPVYHSSEIPYAGKNTGAELEDADNYLWIIL